MPCVGAAFILMAGEGSGVGRLLRLPPVVGLGRIGQADAGLNLTGCRVEYVPELAAGTGDLLAADVRAARRTRGLVEKPHQSVSFTVSTVNV